MTAPFPNLCRDERGTSIIELALVVPLLSALLIGMVDLSRAYAAKLELEQASQRAIEMAMQGSLPSGDIVEALTAEAADAADVDEDDVTADRWLECDGALVADSVVACPVGQTQATYVSVDIEKGFTPLFSTKFLGSNADGTFTLHGKSGIRLQ